MHGRTSSFIRFSTFAAGATFALSAAAGLTAADDGQVTFEATGPAGMKIEGKTSQVSVSEDPAAITVKVPLANLKTGISLRDRHMREKYLEVEKYPEGRLVTTRAALKFPGDGKSSDGDATGKLTLHGTTKDVKFHYHAERKSSFYQVKSSFHLNMKDFGITVPSYLGVTVKPDVDVRVEFKVKES